MYVYVCVCMYVCMFLCVCVCVCKHQPQTWQQYFLDHKTHSPQKKKKLHKILQYFTAQRCINTTFMATEIPKFNGRIMYSYHKTKPWREKRKPPLLLE